MTYEEENWDEEIQSSYLTQSIENKEEKDVRNFTMEEQFEDADDEYETEEKKARICTPPFLSQIKSEFSSLTDSEITSLDDFSYEVNYFALNAQKIAQQFNSVRRKNSREQRKRSLQEFIKLNNYDDSD